MTPPAPRVVATDLDGTLLRSDGTLSARTRAALRAAEAAGIDVVFVTARPPRWLPDLTDAVAGHGHIICLGGACLLDAASGEPLETRGFADEDVRVLAAALREALPGVGFGAERVDGGRYERAFGYTRSWVQDSGEPVSLEETIEATLGGPWPVAKLLARRVAGPRATGTARRRSDGAGSATDAERFLVTARDAVGSRAHLAYSGVPGLAEFFPPGVTKASGLERWCEARGIARREIWAFGDMPNDVPMLRWAGRSFAMGNAHPEVIAAAQTVTASNDEDGVALVLEAMLGASPLRG